MMVGNSEQPTLRTRPARLAAKRQAIIDEDSLSEQEEEEDFESDDAFETNQKPKTPKRKAPSPTSDDQLEQEDEQETTPKPKKAKTTVKKQAKTEDLKSSLFDVVCTSTGAGIAAAVAEWVDEFKDVATAATVDLVNFVLLTSGCESGIDADSLEDEDLIKSALEELQDKLESSESYPLISKKNVGKHTGRKAATAVKFKSNLMDFWNKWFLKLKNLASNSPVFSDINESQDDVDDNPFELIKTWLTLMSSSTFRAFRHTSTFIVLVLMGAIVDALADLSGDLTVLNRQLEGLLQGEGTVDQVDLELEIHGLEERKRCLEKHVGDYFDSVFVHRYRDTDPTIRTECIHALGTWIHKLPSTFLDPTYLRYLGWMLSDASPAVRLESVKALLVLYEIDSMVPLLRPFTERFKSRFIEMALREQNQRVRFVAIPLVTTLSKVGLIADSDRVQVLPLLFSEDLKAREAVAEFVGGVWREEIVVNAREDAEAVFGGEEDGEEDGMEEDGGEKKDYSQLNVKWAEWKALAEFLVEVGEKMQETVRERNAPALVGGESQASGFAGASPSQKSVVGDSQSQSAILSSEFDPVDDDEEGDEERENDLDDEVREELIEKLRTLSELRDWCYGEQEFVDLTAQSGGGNLVAIGPGNMKAAVSTLWSHIEELKDWESILEYLSSDLTIGTAFEDAASQRQLALTNLHKLSPNQEYCLILILNASLSHALETAAEEHGHHRSKKFHEDEEQVSMRIGRVLIKFLPKLLKKYGNEYSGTGQKVLTQVVKMVRCLDVMVYLELRLLKAYESLLEDLTTVFLRQSNGEILREFAETFQYLCGVAVSVSAPIDATEKQPKKGKRALGMEVDNSASSAGLHQSANEKLEDTAEDQIAKQVASFTNRIKAMSQGSSDRIPDDVLGGLLSCLKRMKVLSQVIDM
ncbi:UNVERIFIED_CONTAM: hypothetical protein HDU68_002078, partial [Siphonaria sp. JEL0065]